MKWSTSSIMLASAAWTVQAIPTAIPSPLEGHPRGLSYNAVRSISQSQSKLARQESTAASDAQVPDATSVADIPMSEPPPPTGVATMSADPAIITSLADIPTSDPLSPFTTNVILSEPTEITSVADIPEPLLPPPTADEIISQDITVPQTFLLRFRQQSQVATPIEAFPATSKPVLPTDIPTAVETSEGSPSVTLPTDVPTAVETSVESLTADLPIDFPIAVETSMARSPYTNTASPPTTTS